MSFKLSSRLILLVTILISSVFFYKYGARSYTFYGDALGYYNYLPSVIIYNNLTQPDKLPDNKGIRSLIKDNMKLMAAHKTPLGIAVNQYTYGVALMELPFFLVAHAYEHIRRLPANGYSVYYNYMLIIGGLFYSIAAMLLIYKVLNRYFSKWHSLLAITIIFMGSNLFWFTLHQAGMAHIPLFFLYTALIYCTLRLHDNTKWHYFLLTGLIAGLITVIRPTDILCLLIPLLYNVYNKATLKAKFQLLRKNISGLLLFALAFVLPLIPQLLYWKMVSGQYLYYSYDDQSFNWTDPKIIEGLFGFRNGWLPYSPIMIFAVAGLLCYKAIKKWAWTIWLMLPTYIYIIYSWYCFNYINGYGSRPMIHLYPLLAIALAAFLQFVSQRHLIVKWLIGVIVLFFISINISYCLQMTWGLLDSSESNWAYNRQMLFRSSIRYNDLVVRDIEEKQPDTSKLIKVATLACETYEDSLSTHYVADTVLGSRYVYQMRTDEYQEAAVLKVNKQQFRDAKWIKCSGWFMYTEVPAYYKHLLVLEIEGKLWKGCKIENKIANWGNKAEQKLIVLENIQLRKWGYVYYFVKIPPNLEEGDNIKFLLWNIAKTELFMDNLCIELYK